MRTNKENNLVKELENKISRCEQKDLFVSRMKSAAQLVLQDFKDAKNIPPEKLRKPFTV